MPKKLSSASLIAKVGELAFIVVVIVAVVAGLLTTKLDAVQQAWVFIALMILGVIVSLTTITEAEVGQFMTVSVTLLVASMAAALVLDSVIKAPLAVDYAGTVLGIVRNIMAFVAPAAIIPSLKAVYNLARKK
jgi:D-alanyl-lipoteichoic acid acyltransferase DltB (MBOAT superfamily)